MKRNIIILATLLGSAVLLLCWVCLTDNKTTKTPPQVAEPPKGERHEPRAPYVPTPEDKERWEYTATLIDRLPYISFYTLGMASKLCDWVVVGTVEEAVSTDEEAIVKSLKRNSSRVWLEGYRVVLSVDRFLYGKPLKGKKMTFMVSSGEERGGIESIEQREPNPGDRMLVFLTDKWYNASMFLHHLPAMDIRFTAFDKTKAERQTLDKLYSWSHFILDDKATEAEAIRAAETYLSFFGGKNKRERETYHDLLCSLFQSPVQRIRDDAERDIQVFYGIEASDDIDKLLNDDRMRKEMKDYFRFRFRSR